MSEQALRLFQHGHQTRLSRKNPPLLQRKQGPVFGRDFLRGDERFGVVFAGFRSALRFVYDNKDFVGSWRVLQ